MRKRLGVIVPASNTVAEVDFYRAAPPEVSVHVARAHLPTSTAEGLLGMMDGAIPMAAEQVGEVHPHVMALSATAALALVGPDGEERYLDKLSASVGCPVVSTTKACATHLGRHEGARIGVFTAYIEELNRSLEDYLTKRELDIAFTVGMGITVNAEMAAIEPADLAQRTLEGLPNRDFDVLFVSCANLRAVEAIDQLSDALGKPVITSNQAAVDMALEELGVVAAVG